MAGKGKGEELVIFYADSRGQDLTCLIWVGAYTGSA